MLKSGAGKFVPLSTFLNLSGALVRVWNVLLPVQNAGEFVRM